MSRNIIDLEYERSRRVERLAIHILRALKWAPPDSNTEDMAIQTIKPILVTALLDEGIAALRKAGVVE